MPQEFQESLNKLYCLGLVKSCFLYLNLNYSVNTLKYFFTCCCSYVSSSKYNCLFNFEREGLCLQTLWMRIIIYFGPLCWGDAVTWRKIIPARRDFSFAKEDLDCENHLA